MDEINIWLLDLKSKLSNEEYIRLNYKTIIDSIIERVVEIDVQKCDQLLHSVLEPLMKTLDYNRRHPSPQRSICFINFVEILSSKLSVSSDQLTTNVLNTENLLMKIIKLMLKDNKSEDYDNESVLKISDKLFKFLESIRVLPELDPKSNTIIILNNLVLNTIRCIYLLINNFNYEIKTRDLNQFCGEMLGILKIYSFYGIPEYDIKQMRSSALFPSPFTQFNGKNQYKTRTDHSFNHYFVP